MSNQIYPDAWVIDTAHATDIIEPGLMELEGIRVVATSSTTGGTITLTDAAGNTIWEDQLTTSVAYSRDSRFPKHIHGLRCTAITTATKIFLYPKTYPGA